MLTTTKNNLSSYTPVLSHLSTISEDVASGLKSAQKKLPARLFHNNEGCRILSDILRLPEYYITSCEDQILEHIKNRLPALFSPDGTSFNLIDLEANHDRSRPVLEALSSKKIPFRYTPVNTNKTELDSVCKSAKARYPELYCEPLADEAADALRNVARSENKRRIVMLLGANIGIYTHKEARNFLRELRGQLSPNDLLVIGFDLKKNPKQILDAYNDEAGVSRAFNLNLLQSVNREMDGNFNVSKFFYCPVYDPNSGELNSYLVSSQKQVVLLNNGNLRVPFEAWETIHTEVSKKYDTEEINSLAYESGFEHQELHKDDKGWYALAIWTAGQQAALIND
ncbi:MAG: L-histidine N(alpha)-methyltransferase [Bacteroidota bacterium]